MTSKLFYHSSKEEVQLGDKVEMKRLFWRKEKGIVCYLPGISELHKDFEYDEIKQWAIKTENGNIYPILYDPDNFQPPKNIIFMERGEKVSIEPKEKME